ncbi:hypothetical protein WISP_121211 [Willisornis vidua]|uniref:Uncharacterized protein n=1 Tax=Willisornis vidua TaxID=1566151 RepID=A0ABQ9CYR3_9PASS|nr:hypothetical protein WISP_121211 [Willisornis vidua]
MWLNFHEHYGHASHCTNSIAFEDVRPKIFTCMQSHRVNSNSLPVKESYNQQFWFIQDYDLEEGDEFELKLLKVMGELGLRKDVIN